MAKKVTVTLSDDLNPDLPADDTITFSIDGVGYEIDLNQTNIDAFRDNFAPWIAAARYTSGRRRRTRNLTATAGIKEDLAAVRAWAKENGVTVSSRGRISRDVIDAYHNHTTTVEKKPTKSRVEIALDKAATKVEKAKEADLPAFSSK